MLAFLEEKSRREAVKATADGDGASPAASFRTAPKSSAAGAARACAEDRVDA